MSTSTQTQRSRSPFARPKKDGGSRASFRQLLPYLTEHKRVLGIVIALSIVGAGTSLAQPLLVSNVITMVQKGQALGSLVYLLIGLVVLSAVLSGVQHYLLQRTGTSVVLSARRRLVRRMLRLPISEFDTRRTGDLVSRVGSDTTLLYAVLTQGLVDAIGGALVFLGSLIAMLVIDPVLLGLTVLVIAGSVVGVVALSGRVRVASRKQQEKVGDLAASVERALGAVRTVRASNATDREVAAIEEDAQGAWRMGISVAHGMGPRYTVSQKMSVPQKANPPASPTTSELQNRRPMSDHIIRAGPRMASGHQPRFGNAPARVAPAIAAASTASGRLAGCRLGCITQA